MGETIPALSVVIPTLGSYETLGRVAEGYSAQTAADATFELIVVADAAEDDLEAVERAVRAPSCAVRLVQAERAGASANRNLGASLALGSVILFTDNDTIPTPNLVAEHLKRHKRENADEIGILGNVRWAPELELTTFMRWLDMGLQFDYANMSEGDVGWGRFYTANVSVKRSFFERVGPFDAENFPYGYEDTDWAYRASQEGFQLLYNPEAVVDHLRVMTLDFWKRRARRVAVSEYRFSCVHPEMPPWFHGIFSRAMQAPPAKGRGIRLASYVSPGVPWLGRKVWNSVDSKYKQEIAPHFLQAWEEAEGAS